VIASTDHDWRKAVSLATLSYRPFVLYFDWRHPLPEKQAEILIRPHLAAKRRTRGGCCLEVEVFIEEAVGWNPPQP
jgi:hypothetical protein